MYQLHDRMHEMSLMFLFLLGLGGSQKSRARDGHVPYKFNKDGWPMMAMKLLTLVYSKYEFFGEH